MPRASAAVLVLAGLAAGCGAAGREPVAVVADPAPRPAAGTLGAEPVHVEIAPGETHRYRLPAPAGRWLVVEVEQRAADVDSRILDAAGQVVAEAVTAGNWRREQLDLLTGAGGPYVLEIAAAAGAARPGDVRLRVAVDRPALPDDPARRAARRELRAMELAGAAGELPPAALESRLRSLIAHAEVAWSDAEKADLFHRLGVALAGQERYEDAAAAYRTGLEHSAAAGPSAMEPDLLVALGDVHLDQADRDAAAASYRRAAETARRLGDDAGLSLALSRESYVSNQRGDGAATLAGLRGAIAAAKRAGDTPGELALRLNLSQVLQARGELVGAYAEIEEARGLADEAAIQDQRLLALLLRNAGAIDRVAGDLDRSLAAFAEALEVALLHGDPRVEQSVRLHYGALLNQLGEFASAREHLRRCLRLAESQGDDRYRRLALLHLGWSSLAEGDAAEAVSYLERVVEADADSSGEVTAHDRTTALYALAVARLRLGELEPAQHLLDEVAASARTGGFLLMLLEAQCALGELHLETGEVERAAESLAAAAELAASLDDPTQRASVESLLAQLAAERGDDLAALHHATTAIDLRESVRSELIDPDLRTSFLARWRGDYDLAIETLMRLDAAHPGAGHAREAFRRSEAAHARTLSELLTEARVRVRQGISEQLLEEERQAERHLTLAEAQLATLLGAGEPAAPEARREHRLREAELRRERDLARERRDQVERKIRRSHPRYAEIHYPQPPGVEQVQSWLAPGTALVEFSLGERSSALFLVTRDDFAAVSLPAAGKVAALVGEVRSALERPPSPLSHRLPTAAIAELTRVLVAPLADRLGAVDRLLVVPDRDLFYLPFEVLGDPTAEAAVAGGLLRRWTVGYLPSAAVLPHLAERERTSWERDLRVFADPAPAGRRLAASRAEALSPLPGAESEARRIAELFPTERVDLLVGEAALESRLKSAAATAAARRLHIASHGVISVTDAASSYVLLAADPSEDGRLYLDEVFNLDLAAELVVLSGCETALGPRVEGEGLLGFARGFFYAGARELVVSLWPVSDAGTEELMVAFYGHLLAGAPPDEAMRAAKLERIDAGAHPFVWAPFIVFGAGPPPAPGQTR